MKSSDCKTAIVNASPLICLAKAGLLEILFRVFPKVCIPRPVFEEVMAGSDEDRARTYLNGSESFGIIDIAATNETIRDWDLGAGETAVLSCVFNTPDSIAIIDDAAARKCARTLSIPYCGSLGVLAKAKKSGMIPDLNACVRALRDSGLYLSQEVIDRLNV